MHCHICFDSGVDEDFICDTCEEYYCEGCSYTFSLHYQHQGARCYLCAEQSRLTKLTKEIIRCNQIKLVLSDDIKK